MPSALEYSAAMKKLSYAEVHNFRIFNASERGADRIIERKRAKNYDIGA